MCCFTASRHRSLYDCVEPLAPANPSKTLLSLRISLNILYVVEDNHSIIIPSMNRKRTIVNSEILLNIEIQFLRRYIKTLPHSLITHEACSCVHWPPPSKCLKCSRIKQFWCDLQTLQCKMQRERPSLQCPSSVQRSSQLVNAARLLFFFKKIGPRDGAWSQLLRTDDAELLLSDSESVSSPQLLLLGRGAPGSDLEGISCSPAGAAASLLGHEVAPLADGGLLINAGRICRRGGKGFSNKWGPNESFSRLQLPSF